MDKNQKTEELIDISYSVSELILKGTLKSKSETKEYLRNNLSYEQLVSLSEAFISKVTEDFIKENPLEAIKFFFNRLKKDID